MDNFKKIVGIDFNEFYKKNKLYVYNFLKGFHIDLDLEGVLDISFTNLYNNIEKYDNTKSNILTYLCAISKNELLKEFNKKRVHLINVEEDYVMEYFNNENRDFIEEYDYDIDNKYNSLKT